MAKIKIDGATIDRIISDKGLAVSTTFTDREGNERKEKFTVWTSPAGYQVGETIDVVGNLSVKVDKFEGDSGLIHYAQVNVNNPQIEKVTEDAPF
jgi:hypothetical protein